MFKSEDINITEFNPDFEYDSKAVVRGEELNKAVDAADRFADYIQIKIDTSSSELILQAEGDTDLTERTISEQDMENFTASYVNSVYMAELLSHLTKELDDTNSVKMRLSQTDRPMFLRFPIADGNGHTECYIAPRIS